MWVSCIVLWSSMEFIEKEMTGNCRLFFQAIPRQIYINLSTQKLNCQSKIDFTQKFRMNFVFHKISE